MSTIGAIFVTLCVLMLGIFLQAATNFPIIVFLVVATSIWAAFDASKIGLRKYRVGGATSPVFTLLGCIVLWIIFFPWYLVNKGKIQRGEVMLKEKYAKDHTELLSPGPLRQQPQGGGNSSIGVVKIALGVCLGGLMLVVKQAHF